ncbi:hypothetical protein COOONC_12786 [Cooperia oncophora]
MGISELHIYGRPGIQLENTAEPLIEIYAVSHVKVNLRVSKQPMPPGSPRKGLNNHKYAVDHIKVYKKRDTWKRIAKLNE